MTQEIYYKATLANGTSGYDPNFAYHLGTNVHPNPDKNSEGACGIGIHLAKTIELAKEYVPGYKEIYEARPGVILGEDPEKVRCASCFLVRIISRMGTSFPKPPSLNDEWLDKHWNDITPKDIEDQTLQIFKEGKFLVNLRLSRGKRDTKSILKSVLLK